ncbi:hypothetical protein [Sphingomonas psychrotolerans]|uniref:Uncharacterized protein n=1 Tax=Sphingomonas psychrotolerans TaxID=1327635 RepID=A0A2K8MGG4_9SPHN|nr:hypothetical protein [Sphingomonas psychrotolerans]ATY32064.1 hypothetical protein CVN68_08820 [Sphingomonas psychrotolerans]
MLIYGVLHGFRRSVMKLLQLPRCLFGLHQRDRRRARHDGPFVRSHCIGCGRAMVKDSRGWHLDDAAAPDAGERAASSGTDGG